MALLVPRMSLVDLTQGIAQQHFLRLGRRDPVLELRLSPVRLVPLEAPQTSDDELHTNGLAPPVYMLNMYDNPRCQR